MSRTLPRPLAELSAAVLRGVVGVMTDIDDTLTREGAIEPAALQALTDLYAASVPVVAITGRPLGWSRPFAKAWPVAAVVAENGGVALIRSGDALTTEYAQDHTTRAENSRRLRAVVQRLAGQVPGAQLAQDSPGRATDIAIDHSEFTHLPYADIARVVALMQDAGMTATVSSIHINGWFGTHNKWTAARWIVQRLFGRELQGEIGRWIYVGDSPNDQMMFQHFPLSVGVANLRRFASELTAWPTYITRAERGEGFAELTRKLLSSRD